MYFSEPVIFEVPVWPRIQKFLQVQLQGQPILASPANGTFASVIWAIAQSEKVRIVLGQRGTGVQRRWIYYSQEHSASIAVGINQFHTSRAHMLLNHAEVAVFNEFAQWHLENEFICFMRNEVRYSSFRQAIQEFTGRYDFSEEELSESGLLQLWVRYSKGRTSSGFSELTRILPFGTAPVNTAWSVSA